MFVDMVDNFFGLADEFLAQNFPDLRRLGDRIFDLIHGIFSITGGQLSIGGDVV